MSVLPDYDDAVRRALSSARSLGTRETVSVTAAARRVLAEPVVADRPLPPFNRAQMDGYALRAAEVGAVEAWPVAARVAAGMPADVAVPPGHCVAIATGAPLPGDVDTVIPHEESDRGDPVRFTVAAVDRGRAVHPAGADARAGDVLIAPGTILGPHHLGIATAVGADHVEVARRPRACVLSSGDELRGPGEPVAVHQIRNSNGPMVTALLERCGAEPIAARLVRDERDETIDMVGAALDHDLVITIGGISAGERDHFPAAFDHHRIERSLAGAAIQPGKPVIVGRAPSGCVVVGLPGNPVSALACTCLFAWPIIRVMLGLDADLPWRSAVLAAPVKPNPRRRAFRPAATGADGRITVPTWAGSGDLAHTATTDGLAELPVRPELLERGEAVRFLAWP
ncbi:MAG: molybdopterin molybdotransferase MoeA [Planctomycetes bacterium]|nr:molybdopterin molybdotransferase MoeA [Planctomycetota bacterium]